ncbi:HeH/LEM domain-containing protein [Ligilactobacillus salivarius]|uniref:HeH/LEM domain-containing protein n=1 Tax=Ligilactobacillus salivarius TaxID=1624 RepID=A0AAW7N7D6_9LACO|nr:HeH/LEM domain-containing protein [Ligilactobacillus salivarius]MDD1403493.1 HeH/LEM domain-containing protein [Ligilactobacillus salivarius]MDM8223215.1 HeH/LEM domain-containing protein [Ligilactobacillus salivarius]MDN4833996.1 HeH/LEM domain-containing protein [Ligilactobacillus salivarius]
MSDVQADVKPTSANTVAEIKAYLDKKKISYPSSANKDALLGLVE